VAARLGTGVNGLTAAEARARLDRVGPNRIQSDRRLSRARLLGRQVGSPLVLLLLFAAVAAAFTGAWTDSSIVLAIVLASAGIGFSRESSAQSAVAALQERVHTRARVVRDGRTVTIPVEDVVPGDVVEVSAGSLVPGDGLLIEASDLFVSEAALTGESFPVEKRPGAVQASAMLRERSNCLFFGSNVRSGAGRCLVVETGPRTAFGVVARRLTLRPPETEFDRGVRRFGYLLTSAMLMLVLVVFVAHVFRGRPPAETLLFSIALAVGLSPELLPAILAVNLARGARTMASHGVIVRQLNAIENLGSMDVLCTDKTGTITEGVVRLEGAYDPSGAPSQDVVTLGALNALLETGLGSPLDEAILQAAHPDISRVQKIAEIPFDFVRKRVSVVADAGDGIQIITKGAFESVAASCTELADGRVIDSAVRARLVDQYECWTRQGIRVLAVATRPLSPKPAYGHGDEIGLRFAGFLTFLDRPREGIVEAIADLARLGVSVKIISGDSALVTQHVARLVGLRPERVITGAELRALHDEALWHAAEQTDLFVEVDPNQKERIILALKRTGHVVGFLGDGVNDAPAMHAADASLSVDQAVDVAREAADFVLLDRHLDVIRRGIEEGRRTFANTLKYVLTTTSANLGNMVSMAAASLFLPFLPLLAGQILLNNFLSDIPAIGLAGDSVDPELVRKPERWSMRFIGRFMVEFGILSSLFDVLTFATLIVVFRAPPALFRTAWFVESLLTELAIALVVRSRRPLFQSRPGTLLLVTTIAVGTVALATPYLPPAPVLGFVALPGAVMATICGITVLYVIAAEISKQWFLRSARLAG
jgi:Mg2+-importing ATPase